MRGKQGWVPVLLATGIGIFNGYIVFKPAYDERQGHDPLAEAKSSNEKPLTYTRQLHQWWTAGKPNSELQEADKAK